MAIVVGVFEDYAEAQASVQDLVARGFSSETISAVGRRGGEPTQRPQTSTAPVLRSAWEPGRCSAARSRRWGWPFRNRLARGGGALAAALAGASIGAAAGGVIGVLVDIGVPSAEAEEYDAAVRSARRSSP